MGRESLRRLLSTCAERRERVPVSVAVAVGCGVLEALEVVHETKGENGERLGVVHGNISAEHVLVGDEGRVYLVGFGMASPERTQADDVRHAARLLWESLTGEAPSATDPLLAPSRVAPHVPAALDALLLRAVAGEGRGFGTASETSVALRAAFSSASSSDVAAWLERMVGPVPSDRTERIPPGERLRATPVPPTPATQPLRPLLPGDVYDRYTVEALLGEGGMGSVYLAYDPRLRRLVALKVVAPDSGVNVEDRGRRLKREALAVASLSHPNIVAIYDVGEYRGAPFIAMEYVPGRTLRSFIGDDRVPLRQRVRWLADVARALQVAHAAGVVHRDVKPANAIVRDDGIVKVLDFGIAHKLIADGGVAGPHQASVTQRGTCMGTPAYMAPEQLRGEEVDARADQYAWGVLAYELVSGSHPWPSAKAAVADRRTLPVPLRERAPHVSASVAAAVMRALRPEPAERFGSMQELTIALGRAASQPLAPPLAEEPREQVSGVSTYSTLLEGQGAKQEPSKRRAATAMWVGIAAASLAGAGAVAFAVRSPTHSVTAPASLTTQTDAASGVAITDLPVPDSPSREAIDAYKTAIQQYRDGDRAGATRSFEEAIALDPNLAAAQLRLGILATAPSPLVARAHYAKATRLRSSLSAHDQALLEGYAPLVQEDPANFAEAARRLDAAFSRFPKDAELAYWRASVRSFGTTDPSLLDLFDVAIGFDPAFGLAYAAKAERLAYLDPESAPALTDACLNAVPAAVACLYHRAMLEREKGDCKAMESDARRQVAIEPAIPGARVMLAEAIYAQGSPVEAAAELLAGDREQLSEASRPERELDDAFSIAVLKGDFALAERVARQHEQKIAQDPSRSAHAHVARQLVELYGERGDDALAASVASDYLSRRDGWLGDPLSEDMAVAHEATPAMLVAMLRDRRISPADFLARRAAWLNQMRQTLVAGSRVYAWLHGWAATVQSADDARAALAALDDFGPPRYAPGTLAPAYVGRTFWLAGRQQDALPWLRRGAAECAAIEFPIESARAQMWLGRALEETGDDEGACKSYAAVLARWGGAHPRSVTADEARRRSAALRCPGASAPPPMAATVP